MIPTAGEAVWRLTDSASLYVVADEERAGRSQVAIAVRDLGELGLEVESGGPAVVVDPDGNKLTLFADA
jgi:hypothetical protein